MVLRLPLAGEEKTTLHVSLIRYREAVLWKLEGLDDEQLRQPMVPSGTNLLGLVKHLAGVEYQWFGQTFGRQIEPLETDPVADMNAGPDETTDGIIGFYRRASIDLRHGRALAAPYGRSRAPDPGDVVRRQRDAVAVSGSLHDQLPSGQTRCSGRPRD